MTLDKILAEVDDMVHKGWNDYDNFNDKETDTKLRSAYPHVRTQEDFDKIQNYVLEIMALHHYYKPNK